MRMHGMCLLNMNDAQTGGVGGLTQQSDCHRCQAAPSGPEVGVTGACDNMVCNLALLQGSQPLQSGHLQHCHPCGSQIALLPIRISPDRRIEPIVIGTSGSDIPNLHISTTSSAPLLSLGGGGHCPCCPFHSYDSGFSDSICDSCTNGSSSSDQVKQHTATTTSTTLLQQQGASNPAAPTTTQWKNNNHRLQQLQLEQQGCGSLLKLSEKVNRFDPSGTTGHGSLHCNVPNHHHCHHNHHLLHHHQHHHSGCRHSALSNQAALLNIHTSTHDNKHIPRVILKSPLDPSGEASIQVVDQHLLRPELLHSRSLHDYDNDRHQERCQMGGGHLMAGFPTHRHSTGNTYENVHLKNELNIIAERAMRGNSWGGIVTSNNSSSSDSRSSPRGSTSQSPQVESMNPFHQHQASGSLEESSGSMTGHDQSSGQDQTFDSTCPSWPDEDLNDLGRPSSPSSSGSSEDSSGSSVASWAQNFTGAAENEAHWKTLKASTKKLDKCGFYYEHMSMEQARMRLREMPVGSFLLRDSSHKRYLFSLSAKTPRGVTSVRIEYRNAQFKLDSDEKSQSQTPGFDCVLKLIQYYVELSESKRKNKCVWLESSGRKDTPVLLLKPALQGLQSLSHMCRKVIHKHIDMQRLAQHLKTDFTNLQYLREYPFNM